MTNPAQALLEFHAPHADWTVQRRSVFELSIRALYKAALFAHMRAQSHTLHHQL